MLKRNIELPLEAIDHILEILAGVEEVGLDTIQRAEAKGVSVPRKFVSKVAKISNTIAVLKSASDEVEIAELEELFRLSVEADVE